MTAHTIVRLAIANGELQRQPCEVCGTPDGLAHHDDYSQPLAVRWLCRQHHIQWHATNKAKGDPGHTKAPAYLRFSTDTKRKLALVKQHLAMTATAYIEMALRAQFRKDNIE